MRRWALIAAVTSGLAGVGPAAAQEAPHADRQAVRTWELKQTADPATGGKQCTILGILGSPDSAELTRRVIPKTLTDSFDKVDARELMRELVTFAVEARAGGVNAYLWTLAKVDLTQQVLLQIDDKPAFQLNGDCSDAKGMMQCPLGPKLRAIAPELAQGKNLYLAANIEGSGKKVFTLDTSNFKMLYQTCTAWLRTP